MDATYTRGDVSFETPATMLNHCLQIEKLIILFLARFTYHLIRREAGEAGNLLELRILPLVNWKYSEGANALPYHVKKRASLSWIASSKKQGGKKVYLYFSFSTEKTSVG